MQKSKIVVGEEYLVETDGLYNPGTIDTWHDKNVKTPAFTTHGVSQRWGLKVLAKVVALGQPRPTRGSRYYNMEHDGVLVEFLEPLKIGGIIVKESVTTAVLSTRHIIKLKSEHDAQVRARDEYQRNHDAEALAKAEAFEQEIIDTTNLLKSAGLNPVETDTYLGFDGGSIRFQSTRTSDGTDLIIGWSWRAVEVGREAFLALVERVTA